MTSQKPHGSAFRQPEPRRVVDMPGGAPRRGAVPAGSPPPTAPAAADAPPPPRTADTTRKLQVGREITLAGEIGACDHLVVEGQIEAKLRDCHIIEIADSGVFKGSAEVDIADIGGRFEGDLVVRNRLRVRGSGVVSGSVRYGELEVEVGGRLVGSMDPLDMSGAQPAAAAAPVAPHPVAAVGDAPPVEADSGVPAA